MALLLSILLTTLSSLAAPDAALTAKDLNLSQVVLPTAFDLKDQQFEFLVVDFWASWCGPCQQSSKLFKRESNKWQSEGVLFIGANVDNDQSAARAYLLEKNMGFPQLVDNERKLATKLEVASIPQTLVFDKNLELIKRFRGFDDEIGEQMEKFFSTTFPRRKK